MSLTFTFRGATSHLSPGETLELPALNKLIVPELGTAVITHGLIIKEMDSPVLLVRKPGVMMGRGLLVDQGPVELGEVCTAVFNLWTTRLRLTKGEVVSYLLCL